VIIRCKSDRAWQRRRGRRNLLQSRKVDTGGDALGDGLNLLAGRRRFIAWDKTEVAFDDGELWIEMQSAEHRNLGVVFDDRAQFRLMP